MVKNFIEKTNFHLINGADKYQGLWTRLIKNQKSVTDYAIISENNQGSITEMVIDEDRVMAHTGQ